MDLKTLKRHVLNNEGVSWERTKNNHFVVKRNGVRLCTLPATPSDGRSLLNAISQLRKAGIDIPRK